jgi:hypothetical protein
MNKSIEQLAHDYAKKIRENRDKILDDFSKAYAAQLSKFGHDICLQDICMVEQVGIVMDGHMVTKYWFEYKPKFDLKEEDNKFDHMLNGCKEDG